MNCATIKHWGNFFYMQNGHYLTVRDYEEKVLYNMEQLEVIVSTDIFVFWCAFLIL